MSTKEERVATGIRVKRELLHQARVAAVTQKKTLGQWLEEAILEKIEREKAQPEYNIIIPGRAYSAWGGHAQEYKRFVHDTAAQQIAKPLQEDNLHIRLDYFHRPENWVDKDNLEKSIYDGLKDIAYVDDRQIASGETHLYDITSTITVIEPTSQILEHLVDWKAKEEELVAVALRVRERWVLECSIEMLEDENKVS